MTGALALSLLPGMDGQTPTTSSASASAGSAVNQNVYLTPATVPSAAASLLSVLGDRMHTAGKEQFVLAGTYADATGSVASQIVWQAPGNLLFSRVGASALAYSAGNKTPSVGASSSQAASAQASANQNILESLLDDRPETLFYAMQSGDPYRLLGTRFRTDDGKTPNYAGPWYDIIQISEPVKATGGTTTRQKLFCFDSETGLLARTTYRLANAGATTIVSTEYSGWTTQNGQAVPGKIVRRENGVVVFTFQVTSSAVQAAVSQSAFAAQ